MIKYSVEINSHNNLNLNSDSSCSNLLLPSGMMFMGEAPGTADWIVLDTLRERRHARWRSRRAGYFFPPLRSCSSLFFSANGFRHFSTAIAQLGGSARPFASFWRPLARHTHPSVPANERLISIKKKEEKRTNDPPPPPGARTRAAHAPRLAATGTRSRKQSRRGCGAGTGWADVMHRPCGARPFRVGGARDFPSAGCAAPVSFWG
jgi:hypothetical protein